MSKPVFYVVAAPGVNPNTVKVEEPQVQVLGWKFAEMDRSDLIDLVAAVDKNIKALEKWCDGARGVLKNTLEAPAEAGTETVTPGRFFEAHLIKSQRVALDQEKSKGYFESKGVLAEYMKTTDVLTLKIVAVTQTPGVAG